METEKETPGAPSIALRTVAIVVLVAFAVGFAVGFLVSANFFPKTIKVTTPTISVQIDTVTKRDTVHGKITAPVTRTIIRVDTVHLPALPDTTYKKVPGGYRVEPPDTGARPHVNANGSISIPIEQRTYATDDYLAVVSGWHPSLDKITLYPKNTTVSKTTDRYTDPPRRNWVLAVGPAAFYGFDRKFLPGAAVTLGFVVKSWH